MKKKDTKIRLFEIMEKINPDFKLNEISYNTAQEGKHEYQLKLKEVFSEFDNRKINVHLILNNGDDIIIPSITKIQPFITVEKRPEPYDIRIYLNIFGRGEILMSVFIHEIQHMSNNVIKLYKDSYLDAPELEMIEKFIRMAAPYAKLDSNMTEYIIKKMYEKFGKPMK